MFVSTVIHCSMRHIRRLPLNVQLHYIAVFVKSYKKYFKIDQVNRSVMNVA